VSCCSVGAAAGVGDGVQTCCAPGHTCVKEITGPNAAITPDSTFQCCPPERLVVVSQFNTICCPPGKVKQPAGTLSTNGGLCCTAEKVCGADCCDSLPSFPKVCKDGRCEFDFARIFPTRATAREDGIVPVPMRVGRPVAGSMLIEHVGATQSLLGTAAATQVLGKARFRAKRRGSRTVEVRLSRKARALLRKRKRGRPCVAAPALVHEDRAVCDFCPCDRGRGSAGFRLTRCRC
jgi:hypothetical protein